MQQVKLAKFKEGEEEGLRLNWDDAQPYMDAHGLSGDKGGVCGQGTGGICGQFGVGPSHL
eukprot:10397736-Karenia_brevis.AAC.1